jgi:hypothetical protein
MGGLSRFVVKPTKTIATTPPEFLIPAGRRLHAGDGVNTTGEATTFNRFEGESLKDGYGLRAASAMISPLDKVGDCGSWRASESRTRMDSLQKRWCLRQLTMGQHPVTVICGSCRLWFWGYRWW